MRPEIDTEHIITGGGTPLAMMGFVEAYESRQVWTNILNGAVATHDEPIAETARNAIADLPEISDLDGLRVTTRLIRELDGGRWLGMRDAREAGVSWDDIAVAVQMTTMEARDWYAKKIRERETYCADFHDAERARAVLDD